MKSFAVFVLRSTARHSRNQIVLVFVVPTSLNNGVYDLRIKSYVGQAVLVLEKRFFPAFMSYRKFLLPGDGVYSSNDQIEDDDEDENENDKSSRNSSTREGSNTKYGQPLVVNRTAQ